jgi:hypothetical protein
MRFIATGVIAIALLVGASSSSATNYTIHKHHTKLENRWLRDYFQVKHRFGPKAAGRDVVYRGWLEPSGTVRADSRPADLRRSDAKLRSWLHPPIVTPPLSVHASSATPTPAPVTYAGGKLSAIRQCESGNDYSTNTGNGFYGAYQFTQSTWESVGGSGNPANASPEEQDRRAAMLMSQSGTSPWPVCGSR